MNQRRTHTLRLIPAVARIRRWVAVLAPLAILGGAMPSSALAQADSAESTPRQTLRVCVDPGNPPFSDTKEDGFENRIAEVLATALKMDLKYYWRPTIERGLTRQTLDTKSCDVMMDMPVDYEGSLTTRPIYRTTYVLVYRKDKGYRVKSLDDPLLKKIKLGVFQISGARETLRRHGVTDNVVLQYSSWGADLDPELQPLRQVEHVVDGTLDMAAVWGPFAGYLVVKKGAPLVLQPINVLERDIPLEFDLSLAVGRSAPELKGQLEQAMDRNKDKVRAILEEYGVPLVQCAECLISGPLPSHGPYKQVRSRETDEEIAADEQRHRVPKKVVDEWLKSGASLEQELVDAALGGDSKRVEYLLRRGAPVNGRNAQGDTPLVKAAQLRTLNVLTLLLKHGADVNIPDADGWSPLMLAILKHNPHTATALVNAGARIDYKNASGWDAMTAAMKEGRADLIALVADHGGDIKLTNDAGYTPLMLIAIDGSVPAAEVLLRKGADVNSATPGGLTALMLAAAHGNADMARRLLGADAKADARNAEGQTALAIAKDRGERQVVALLDSVTVRQDSTRGTKGE